MINWYKRRWRKKWRYPKEGTIIYWKCPKYPKLRKYFKYTVIEPPLFIMLFYRFTDREIMGMYIGTVQYGMPRTTRLRPRTDWYIPKISVDEQINAL